MKLKRISPLVSALVALCFPHNTRPTVNTLATTTEGGVNHEPRNETLFFFSHPGQFLPLEAVSLNQLKRSDSCWK